MARKSKGPQKPILINFPVDLVEKMDEFAETMNMSRTELIIRCLKRELEFIETHEMPLIREHRRQLFVARNQHDEEKKGAIDI